MTAGSGAVPRRSRARFGVASRVVAGLAAMTLFAVAGIVVGVLSFEQARQAFAQVALRQLPAALAASEVGRQSQAVATVIESVVPQLMSAGSEAERTQALARIGPQVERLHALVAKLPAPGIDPRLVESARRGDAELHATVIALDGAVRQRIRVEDRGRAQLAALLDAQDGLGTVGRSDWGERADELMGLLLPAMAAADTSALDTAAGGVAEAARAADAAWAALAPDDRAPLARIHGALAGLLDPAAGALATRRGQLGIKSDIDAILGRYGQQTQAFIAAIATLIDDLQRDVSAETAELDATLARRSHTLILLGALCLAGALAITAYVSRGVVRRLIQLRDAMVDHAAGRPGPIPRSGGDELAEMGDALAHFVSAISEREAQLRHARDAADTANQTKSAFLAAMSHEIRTPMNGIVTMSQLLGESRLDADQQAMVGIVTDSAAALLGIINDILDFSKIEAGRLEIERVETSIGDAVEGATRLLAATASERGLELLVDVDPLVPPRVLSDPTRLRQVLLNLLGNAIKFTEAGHVALTVRTAANGEIRFEVADTGIGMTPEQIGKLFQPFVQADSSTTRRFGGTGLGLSICRRLVELMGGAIGADSVPGQGSTFWFTLPMIVVTPADPRHATDLAGVRVAVVTRSAPLAGILDRQLASAGATVSVLPGPAPLVVTRVDLAVVDAAVLPTGTRPPDGWPPTILLTEPRAPPVAGWAARLAKPVRRRSLLQRAAEALGRAAATAPEGVAADVPWIAPDPEAAAAAGARLLIAEDNPTNQLVISKMLARCGFVGDVAQDGEDAWAKLSQGRYGALITDLRMPALDGYGLAGRIRAAEAEGARPGRLPIVALTADAVGGVEASCRAAGMDAVLTKPFDRHDFEATVIRLVPAAGALRRPGEAGSAAPVVNGTAVAGPIDIGFLIASFGGINDEARELLALFLKSARPLLGQLDQALSDGNVGDGRFAAHAVRGSAASVGANALADLCAVIETALQHGDLAAARLRGGEVRPLFDAIAAQIGTI